MQRMQRMQLPAASIEFQYFFQKLHCAQNAQIDARGRLLPHYYYNLFATPFEFLKEGVCPICTGQARLSFHAAHTCEILWDDRIKALKGLKRACSQISKI